jgi:hypothetical protein
MKVMKGVCEQIPFATFIPVGICLKVLVNIDVTKEIPFEFLKAQEHSEMSLTNANDDLPRVSLGRVEDCDSIVER